MISAIYIPLIRYLMFGCIKTSLVAAFLERYVFKSGILMGLKLFKRVKINVAVTLFIV